MSEFMLQLKQIRAKNFVKVGDVFGYLTCTQTGLIKNKRSGGVFKCHCGRDSLIELRDVYFNGKKSCGCTRFKDVIGHRINTFTITNFSHKKDHVVYYSMVCDCGYVKCAKLDTHSNCIKCSKRIKHGFTVGRKQQKEYSIWSDMIKRCRHKGNRNSSYLEKGIKVCERWEKSFQNFINDMGRIPKSKSSIDRIDNNGNYDPSNCRWADNFEQANNRSNNRLIIIDDQQFTVVQASKKYGVKYRCLLARLNRGWSDVEAVNGKRS